MGKLRILAIVGAQMRNQMRFPAADRPDNIENGESPGLTRVASAQPFEEGNGLLTFYAYLELLVDHRASLQVVFYNSPSILTDFSLPYNRWMLAVQLKTGKAHPDLIRAGCFGIYPAN